MKRTVQDVMTRKVVVARDDERFKRLAELLSEHHVSALPILDGEGRLVGIATEADLLLKAEHAPTQGDRHRFLSRRDRIDRAKASGLIAREIMTSPVITVSPTASLAEAARLIHEKKVKRLPVVDAQGKVIGIVSRADLLKVFLRSDSEILAEVEGDLIQRTLMLEPGSVRVAVRAGVVSLEGEVERRSLVDVLVGIVHGVDGVVGVQNHLSYRMDDTKAPSYAQSTLGVVPERFVSQSGKR